LVLEQDDRDDIIRFVREEPRAVQEVADHVDVAWVTAERYVKKIAEDTGVLSLKVFREGTRGALKLVHYNAVDAPVGSHQWEAVFESITAARWKEDFDPMDIRSVAETGRVVEETRRGQTERLKDLIRSTSSQILVFSGNFSFATVKDTHGEINQVLTNRLDDGVVLKGLARANLASVENFSDDLFHHDNIEVRHSYQPLRGVIVDEQTVFLRSLERAERYKEDELQDTVHLSYVFTDEEVVDWLKKVFWNMYRASPNIDDRLSIYRSLS
jgi:hypothetical protein